MRNGALGGERGVRRQMSTSNKRWSGVFKADSSSTLLAEVRTYAYIYIAHSR